LRNVRETSLETMTHVSHGLGHNVIRAADGTVVQKRAAPVTSMEHRLAAIERPNKTRKLNEVQFTVDKQLFNVFQENPVSKQKFVDDWITRKRLSTENKVIVNAIAKQHKRAELEVVLKEVEYGMDSVQLNVLESYIQRKRSESYVLNAHGASFFLYDSPVDQTSTELSIDSDYGFTNWNNAVYMILNSNAVVILVGVANASDPDVMLSKNSTAAAIWSQICTIVPEANAKLRCRLMYNYYASRIEEVDYKMDISPLSPEVFAHLQAINKQALEAFNDPLATPFLSKRSIHAKLSSYIFNHDTFI
jgi:hypothetical protein